MTVFGESRLLPLFALLLPSFFTLKGALFSPKGYRERGRARERESERERVRPFSVPITTDSKVNVDICKPLISHCFKNIKKLLALQFIILVLY